MYIAHQALRLRYLSGIPSLSHSHSQPAFINWALIQYCFEAELAGTVAAVHGLSSAYPLCANSPTPVAKQWLLLAPAFLRQIQLISAVHSLIRM